MVKEFNNALDECLERLLTQGETIEQCLQGYPDHAVELKPLLETVMAARKALEMQPPAEFKARAGYQFRSKLEEIASQKSRPSFGWIPRWATMAALVFGLLLTGGGTVGAAGYSMPDSPLYPLKLATEQVQLKLAPSAIAKTELNARLIDKRVAEIIYIANKDDVQQIESAIQRLDKRLAMLTTLASAIKAEDMPTALAPAPALKSEEATTAATSEEAERKIATPSPEARGGRGVKAVMSNRAKLKEMVAHYAANHPAVLRAGLEKSPEAAKPALRRALALAEARYQQAIEALD